MTGFAKKFAAAALLWLAMAPAAFAGSVVFVDDGAAIRGTDPVAYFTDGRAVPGKAAFEAEWMGATWRFASAAHRDAFKTDPEKYAPQYGGFCAWAVSQGYSAPIDPAAWKIVGGKLYLNYSRSIQSRWALDRSGNIARADRNWPKVRAGLEGK
jgi:YHS domain-containing protein